MPASDTDTPRRGRTPKLLRVACPTCGAVVNAYCRSSTGKVLANGHQARREAADMGPAKSGLGSNTRPPATSADELVSAIKRAAKASKGIRLSGAEAQILAKVLP